MVGGRYRVGKTLGRGGMGEVVEAKHEQLGTRVAIKVMRAERAQKPELIERFLREARAAAQLQGEHVCRVHDFGTLEAGPPYMVMELLTGRDLASIIKDEGGIEPGLAARYITQACEAMAEAHALGIIHRDLKPSNLFLCLRPDGTTSIKVLDFGIAKAIGHDSALTDTDHAIGSPAYMSPEQVRSSKAVDARTDIWSLGIVMFELLTGKLPFEADNPAGLALAITTQKAPALPPAVPKKLAEAVKRCLHRDAERRYADVGELAAALEPFVTKEDKPATSLARRLSTGPVLVDGALTTPEIPSNKQAGARITTSKHMSGEIQRSESRRSFLPLGLAIAGALAIGSIVTYVAVGGRGNDEPSPAAAPAPSGTTAAPSGTTAAPSGTATAPSGTTATAPVDAGTAEVPSGAATANAAATATAATMTDAAATTNAAATTGSAAPADAPGAPAKHPARKHAAPPPPTTDLSKSRY